MVTQICEAQIQKQIPFVEAEPCGCKIFADLVCGAPTYTTCKTQVIMRERIIIVRPQNFTMQRYCCGIILQPKHEISIDVAYLFFWSGSLTRSNARKDISVITATHSRKSKPSRGIVGHQGVDKLSRNCRLGEHHWESPATKLELQEWASVQYRK